MSPGGERVARVETGITVRYWAAARAAAGIGEETFASPVTLDTLRELILGRHQDNDRLRVVLDMCSVLVEGRQPAPGQLLEAGVTVEFLPPFAGG
jgi:molybdopterin synthase sulfur carrier subunit